MFWFSLVVISTQKRSKDLSISMQCFTRVLTCSSLWTSHAFFSLHALMRTSLHSLYWESYFPSHFAAFAGQLSLLRRSRTFQVVQVSFEKFGFKNLLSSNNILNTKPSNKSKSKRTQVTRGNSDSQKLTCQLLQFQPGIIRCTTMLTTESSHLKRDSTVEAFTVQKSKGSIFIFIN